MSNILELISHDPPLIKDYLNLKEQVQPCGFDLTLREVSKIKSGGAITTKNEDRVISDTHYCSFNPDGRIWLTQGPYIIMYNEEVNIPLNIMALVRPRSSLLRCGVSIHTAVWDPGYNGRSVSLLVVHTSNGITLEKDARIAQMIFFELQSETEGYNGIYQGENL
jgi:dUTP pyrophosphatase